MTDLYRTIILTAAAMLFMAGCAPEEPLINSFVDEWRLLATSGGTDLHVRVVPDGAGSDVNPNSVDFGTSPSMMQFRNNVYIYSESRPWIVVFDAERLVYVDTIFTFQVLDGIADLCFANATTAYATSPKSGCIGVIDLTTSTVAKTIVTPGAPRQIACLGNQMLATIPDSNVSVVIDTRTNEIEDRLAMATRPWFVREDAVANVFCVVSLGAGKVENSEQTTPSISFVSPSTREVLKTLDLTVKASDGPRQVPRGLAITATQNAFVPVQSGLLRVSTRTRSRVSSAQTDSFDIVAYNEARAEIICQRAAGGTSPQIVVFDENGSERNMTITLPKRVSALLGIPR